MAEIDLCVRERERESTLWLIGISGTSQYFTICKSFSPQDPSVFPGMNPIIYHLKSYIFNC